MEREQLRGASDLSEKLGKMIFSSLCKREASPRRKFGVEYDDGEGGTKDKYFRSRASAEEWARKFKQLNRRWCQVFDGY